MKRIMVSHPTLVDAIQELYRSPLLRSLPSGAVQKLLNAAAVRHCAGGEIIFQEGERGDSMLLIVSGWALLTHATPSGRQVELGRVGPGDVLGEMALIEPGPRSATATVLTPMVVYELHVTDFDSMIDDGDEIALQLLRRMGTVLGARLRAVDRRIQSEFLSAKGDNHDTHRGEDPKNVAKDTPTRHSTDLTGNENQYKKKKNGMNSAETVWLPPLSSPSAGEEPTPSRGVVEAPRFELARQRGLWKILLGLRDE